MSRLARRSALIVITCVACFPVGGANAQATVNDQIVDQLRRECVAKGGRFENSTCHLPDKRTSSNSSRDSSCGLGCAVGVAIVGLAAARIAYCKANPEKC